MSARGVGLPVPLSCAVARCPRGRSQAGGTGLWRWLTPTFAGWINSLRWAGRPPRTLCRPWRRRCPRPALPTVPPWRPPRLLCPGHLLPLCCPGCPPCLLPPTPLLSVLLSRCRHRAFPPYRRGSTPLVLPVPPAVWLPLAARAGATAAAASPSVQLTPVPRARTPAVPVVVRRGGTAFVLIPVRTSGTSSAEGGCVSPPQGAGGVAAGATRLASGYAQVNYYLPLVFHCLDRRQRRALAHYRLCSAALHPCPAHHSSRPPDGCRFSGRAARHSPSWPPAPPRWSAPRTDETTPAAPRA